MVKLVVFIKRKPGMSVDAFQHYWRTTHADIVARLPGIRKYVQSHTLASGYAKGQPVYDGIAEIWCDDTRALRAQAGTPELAAIQADEPKFIDTTSMGTILTEEHVIKEGPVPAGAVKSVEFLVRKSGMDVAAFQAYWRQVHGPIAATIPVLRRYVQSHPRPSSYEGGRRPAWDGFAITWFDDTRAMRVSATTPEYARTIADEPNFLAPGPAPFIIAREHVIVA